MSSYKYIRKPHKMFSIISACRKVPNRYRHFLNDFDISFGSVVYHLSRIIFIVSKKKIESIKKLIELNCRKTLRPSKESRDSFGSRRGVFFFFLLRSPEKLGTVSQYLDTFNDETRSKGRKISGRRERLRHKRHALSHIFSRFS